MTTTTTSNEVTQRSITLCSPDAEVRVIDPVFMDLEYRQYIDEKDADNYENLVQIASNGNKFFNRGHYDLWHFPYDSYSQKNANIVKRHDFAESQIDKRNKIIILQHQKEESYRLYRYSDIIRCLQKDDWLIVIAEGEKCVEQLLSIDVLATTFQASDWARKEAMLGAFLELKNMRKLGGIACFYDGDETGFKHAVDCEEVCKYVDIPFKMVSPELLRPNHSKGYDIGDWLTENEDLSIADKQSIIIDLIGLADRIPLEKEAYIKSPEETEKCFIASLLRACESMHQINDAAVKAKSKESLIACAEKIEPCMLQDEEISGIYDWYRYQIISGIFPTYQSAKNCYLKVQNYYRIQNKYKLDFLAKEVKINYAKRLFNSEALNVLHGRSDGRSIQQIISELTDNDATFETRVSPILEQYPTATGIKQFELKQQLKKQFKLHAIEVDSLVKAYSAPLVVGLPTWMSGKAFLEQESESDKFIYPELLLAGRVNLIVGIAGAGKSSFSFDLAASWALDEPYLNELPSRSNKPKMIVFVNSDQSFKDLQKYCRNNHKIVKCAQLGKFQPFGKTQKDASPFTLPYFGEFAKNITELSQVYELLIVVDSLSGINQHNASFSDTDTDASVGITLFQGLCDRTGSTALMIHHAVKDHFAQGIKKCRGNSRIAEEASSLLIIEQIKDDQTKRVVAQYLEIPKMRGSEPGKRDLIHNHEDFTYLLKPGFKQQDADRINVAQIDLLGIMQRIPGEHEISGLMRNFSIGNKANSALIETAFNRLIMRDYVKTHFDVSQNKVSYSLIQ